MNFTTNTWDSLSMFYSASTTQNYLHTYYMRDSLPDSKIKSFQNAPVFIHYLKSAEIYYKEANLVSLEIQPVLLFYGYIQLIKACLLSLDPYYPSSSTLLAHGVTTRKRKKQQYEFLQDEIKIQRNGLFSYMSSKMFHVKHLDGEKLLMKDLFFCLPELAEQFQYFFQSNCYLLHKHSNVQYSTIGKCLDDYHMPAERLASYLNSHFHISIACKEEREHLIFQLDEPLTTNYHQPFHFDSGLKQFTIINKQDTLPFKLNEMLVHYLLLYNLSMIARYETEWWMDLTSTTPNEDYPFIKKFINVTLNKGPLLIKEWLFGERDYLYRHK